MRRGGIDADGDVGLLPESGDDVVQARGDVVFILH